MTATDHPLTYEQEAIWIAEQFVRDPSPFLETWAQQITGPLDVPALERALRALARRHATFRTSFDLDDAGEPVQRIDPDAAVDLERLPWPGGDMHEVLRRAGQRPLDLTVSPVRWTLLERAPDDHLLLLQVHHVAVDDVSLVVLDEELGALYRAELTGDAVDLPPIGPTLGDHARAQRSAGIDPAALDFWRQYLDGVGPLESLPPAPRSLPERQGREAGCVRETIPPDTGQAVWATARKVRTTATVLMSTCMAIVLAAGAGTDDVVIGIPVSHRGERELERVFGCVTDLLPVRYSVPADVTLAQAFAAAKRSSLAALRHRQVPYAAIGGGMSGIRGVLSGEHLGRVVFGVDEAPGRLELPGLRCRRVYVAAAAAKFDWCQYVVAEAGGYDVRADYATDYFTADQAAATLAQWLTVLSLTLSDPDLTVGQVTRRLAAIG